MAGRELPRLAGTVGDAAVLVLALVDVFLGLAMASVGTGIPALRQPRKPCTWVIWSSLRRSYCVLGADIAQPPDSVWALQLKSTAFGQDSISCLRVSSSCSSPSTWDRNSIENRGHRYNGVRLRVADQSVERRLAEQVVDRPADALGVRPWGGGRTGADQRGAGNAVMAVG